MSRNIFSILLIYIHAFFLSVGNSTLSPTVGNIPILDIFLLIYLLINFKSISITSIYIRDILLVLALFVFVSFSSTVINSYFFYNTAIDNSFTFLRYISYALILFVYFDFLENNPAHFKYLLITFLFGILSLVVLDIYVANQISNYNFFTDYGRYIFSQKYAQEEFCFNTFFCHKLINVNTLSSYIGIVSFLIFGLIFKNDQYHNLLLKIILFFFIFIFIFISVGLGQKTAYIPYFVLSIISLIYFIYYVLIKNYSFIKIIVSVMILLFIYSFFAEEIFHIYNTMYYRTFEDGRISSFVTRYSFAADAINLISNPVSLFIGNGKDAYHFAKGINDPHNINAQLLLETGLIGFILYSYIIFQLIRHSYKYSIFFAINFIIMYFIMSNANGLAFQSHTAWISFTFILYLGTRKREF
ncbi:hypothetical protein OA342_00470 [Pelagibacteraceae bacterium]|nr:hypothetical protein [Pelagibacteraceae bacterium]